MKTLYVTDRGAIGDERWLAVLSALRKVRDLSVQVREKAFPDREVLTRARLARETLGDEVCLYVNRRFDIALAAGADGVHLPADGLPLPRVKANAPRGFRVGVSTHSVSEAIRAIEENADLVLIGPIFDTPSKRTHGAPLGVEVLSQLPPRTSHTAQVLAIGGIDEPNLGLLEPYRDRVSGVAGIRLFQDSPDPRAVAERIVSR